MNKELINGVIDATLDFIGACANDVCNNAEDEYTVFEGALKADSEGNLKVYSKSGDLVSQTPVRKILNNLKGLGHKVIDLIDQDDQDRKAEEEAEAKEEAERQEAENKEIDNEIDSLESQVETLKLRKKPVRRFTKRLSFKD